MAEKVREPKEELIWLIGDTGEVHEWLGGFKVKVYHSRSFPWDDVFKALLYREFKVYVTRHKADLFIEAVP